MFCRGFAETSCTLTSGARMRIAWRKHPIPPFSFHNAFSEFRRRDGSVAQASAHLEFCCPARISFDSSYPDSQFASERVLFRTSYWCRAPTRLVPNNGTIRRFGWKNGSITSFAGDSSRSWLLSFAASTFRGASLMAATVRSRMCAPTAKSLQRGNGVSFRERVKAIHDGVGF